MGRGKIWQNKHPHFVIPVTSAIVNNNHKLGKLLSNPSPGVASELNGLLHSCGIPVPGPLFQAGYVDVAMWPS